jgi:hypothetical protein
VYFRERPKQGVVGVGMQRGKCHAVSIRFACPLERIQILWRKKGGAYEIDS